MILRRFTQHIKEQNWFAVGLDVIVVVVGIFLGMQVTEWNEQRQFNENEGMLLEQLKDEIESNNVLARNRIEFMGEVVKSGKRAIEFLEVDQECEPKCWNLLVDFFIASQSLFSPSNSNVYEEMLKLGLPRSNKVKESIEKYYVLNATTYSAIDKTPKYRQLLRELLSYNAHKVLWENCHSVEGFLEVLISECDQLLSDKEIQQILDKFKSRLELAEYLNHWIGMHHLWMPIYTNLIFYGDEAIDTINGLHNN